ncbi:hypothetical protein CUU95_12675 [Vreelandella alkaliphila]|uniref:ATP-grasp fold amidoligase family protein n=1 Tax=Vreelandella alkaliphila TaxID=272774 RepID=UPI000EA02A11|nr:ATP-grasp fold amidoligase family protein [Halomonas alkaliphila]AYF34608.1 hypothetical protein CUU95_12675 [Halomonas alkaliphila]
MLLSDMPPFHVFVDNPAMLVWVHASHPARKGSPPLPPSFRASIDALARRYQREALQAGVTSFKQRSVDRDWVTEQMSAQNVATARILSKDFALQHLRDVLEGIDACVIKPKEAHSSRGVLSLKRIDAITFNCLQERRPMRLVEILEHLYSEMREHQFPNHWQLEELLLPPSGLLRPVDDFKFYAFRGHSALVLQVARSQQGQRYRWYDRDWCPVDTGKYDGALDPALLPPRNPKALLAVAERISANLPVPFCRVDLYETYQGVVLGELTAVPGTYHAFGEHADAYLGAMFELANCV